MVKQIKCALTAVSILLSMPLSALAAGQINAVYNSETKEALISGTADAVFERVSVTVLPEGVSPETLSENDVNKNGYILRQTQSGKNGEFSINVKLSDSAQSSVYNIYAVCGAETLTASFSHVSDSEVSEVTAKINGAASAEAVAEILKSSQKNLGLSDVTLKNAAGIAEIIYRLKPSGGYTRTGFMNELNRAIAIVSIADGENVKSVLIRYGEAFEFSQADAAALSDELCAGVQKYFNANTGFGDSKKYLYGAVTYSGFENAASYVEVEQLLRKYGVKAGADFSKYDNLTSAKQTSVMQKLYNENPASFEEIHRSFESLTAAAAAESSGGGGGGGGGGKGGGMSSVGSAVKAPSYSGLSDMENHWSRSYVEELIKKGIIAGYTDNTFRPESYVTRAEFIKLALLATGGKTSAENRFADVSSNDWFAPYVNGAAESGICEGFDGKINPYDNITREDAAVIIYRTLKISTNAAGVQFSDSGNIADYASEAVAFLSENGIITGSDSLFNPKNSTKRGEAAALISRFMSFNGGK